MAGQYHHRRFASWKKKSNSRKYDELRDYIPASNPATMLAANRLIAIALVKGSKFLNDQH